MNVRIIGAIILLMSLACASFAADAPDASTAAAVTVAEGPKVSLDANNTPFADAMADVGKQAGVQIVCDPDVKKTVTGHFASMDLEKLMDTLTKVNTLTWQKLYVPVPTKDDKPLTVDQIKTRVAAVAAMTGGPIVLCDSAGRQKVYVEQDASAPSVDPAKLGLKVLYFISTPTSGVKKDASLSSQIQALDAQRMALLAKMSPQEQVSALQNQMQSMMDMDPSARQQMMIDQFTAQQNMRQDPQYQQAMQQTMQALRQQGLLPAASGAVEAAAAVVAGSNMKLITKTGLLLFLVTISGIAAFAQGPGGAFADFREKHKATFELMQMVVRIDAIDKDAKHALRPDQAKRVVSVLRPLRSKQQLTQDKARQTTDALNRILTPDQRKAMANIKPPARNDRRGFGNRPGGGFGHGGPPPNGMQGRHFDGGPGGPRPGAPMRMIPADMAKFNPFYSDPKQHSGRAKRWDAFFVRLDKESKAAPARHAKTVSKS